MAIKSELVKEHLDGIGFKYGFEEDDDVFYMGFPKDVGGREVDVNVVVGIEEDGEYLFVRTNKLLVDEIDAIFKDGNKDRNVASDFTDKLVRYACEQNYGVKIGRIGVDLDDVYPKCMVEYGVSIEDGTITEQQFGRVLKTVVRMAHQLVERVVSYQLFKTFDDIKPVQYTDKIIAELIALQDFDALKPVSINIEKLRADEAVLAQLYSAVCVEQDKNKYSDIISSLGGGDNEQ